MDLTQTLKTYLSQFSGKKIAVIGDLMLDEHIFGTVNRISPEAPVPILHVQKENKVPGGAGNSAYNLSTLGAKVTVHGIIGKDIAGKEMISLFEKKNIFTKGIIKTDLLTIRKIRLIADSQHITRVDYESQEKISEKNSDKILNNLKEESPDAILISDYSKHLNTFYLMQNIISYANQKKIPIVVDTKSKNYEIFNNATVLTPNHHDASKMTGILEIDEESLKIIGAKLVKETNSKILMTRGKDGMSIFTKGSFETIPSKAKKVYDITGAGDTVASILTLALASGANLKDSAEIATAGAAAVISKIGTSTITIDEIKYYL